MVKSEGNYEVFGISIYAPMHFATFTTTNSM